MRAIPATQTRRRSVSASNRDRPTLVVPHKLASRAGMPPEGVARCSHVRNCQSVPAALALQRAKANVTI
eukprot:220092-Rhodomonas_salina.6